MKVVLGFPAKGLLDTRNVCTKSRWVARATLCKVNFEVDAGDILNLCKNLENAASVAGANVEYVEWAVFGF